jgi:hypothetical protein
MIFTKANFQIVEIAGVDKANPLLGWICFTDQGESIALNAKSGIVVQGIEKDRAERVPLDKESWSGEKVLSVEHVKEILKGIEPDKLFGGILEAAEVKSNGTAELTNGKRRTEIKGGILERPWLPWRKVFRSQGGERVIVDSKRMSVMLSVMQKLCDFIEMSICQSSRQIVLIGVNARTRQGVLGIVSGYKEEEIDVLKKVKEWARKLLTN